MEKYQDMLEKFLIISSCQESTLVNDDYVRQWISKVIIIITRAPFVLLSSISFIGVGVAEAMFGLSLISST